MAKKVIEVQSSIMDAAGNSVSANPALIVYPTDVWGMTTDLKAAVKFLAARVCGCPEKYKVVQDTLTIALEHMRVRYEEDKARLEADVAEQKEDENAPKEPEAE